MIKADVVLASHEALVSDVSVLRAISWEVVIIDERERSPTALAKAYQAASDLDVQCRMTLHSSPLQQVWRSWVSSACSASPQAAPVWPRQLSADHKLSLAMCRGTCCLCHSCLCSSRSCEGCGAHCLWQLADSWWLCRAPQRPS